MLQANETKESETTMLIDIKEVEEMVKSLPKVALVHPGVKLLISFVGKTVRAVNSLDERLKRLEGKDKADS